MVDYTSIQGAYLVNCTLKVRHRMCMVRQKLCLVSTIQFHKPNIHDVTRLAHYLLVSTLSAENRDLHSKDLRSLVHGIHLGYQLFCFVVDSLASVFFSFVS